MFSVQKTCHQCYKTFFGVIYTTRGVFPCDFDWGYADSNVIKSR